MKKLFLLFISFFSFTITFAVQPKVVIIDKNSPSRDDYIVDILSLQKSLIVSPEAIPEAFLQRGFLLVPMTAAYVSSLLERKEAQIVSLYLDQTLLGYIILTIASEFEELYQEPLTGSFETEKDLGEIHNWLSDPLVGYIEQIGVHSAYTRLGLGSMLIACSKALKPHGLISDVFIDPIKNSPSLSFFSSQGFTCPGILYQYPGANANFPRNHKTQVFFWHPTEAIDSQKKATAEDFLFYKHALVRDLSDGFEDSLKLHPPESPINLALAREQHENYISLLEKLVPNVIRLEGNPNHPDCNFIEDTAVIVGDTAVISRMGAPQRRGEELAVKEALTKLGVKNIITLTAPCTVDGGDLLYTGNHLFVGLSKRTNKEALYQLTEIFKDKTSVIGIPVVEGLHLKSIVSLFDAKTLIVAATPAGIAVQDSINVATDNEYVFVSVPDSVAANTLRIGNSLIIQEGFPESEAILQALSDKKEISLVKLNMSELIKADGALTCGSLLLHALTDN
ncbi:MAG: GNAT family N-acetyltransferase [Verrucomicrobia bacterium]|nr:GNAT family N-acetyltransferase [Verrucomicrobiota bacterium]